MTCVTGKVGVFQNRGGGEGEQLPIQPLLLLNEIQTMFSQLAKKSWSNQLADSCIAHEESLSQNKKHGGRCQCANAVVSF